MGVLKLTKGKRRNKGEGSFTILPNGKYKMTITIGVGIDGKQKRKSVTASTRQELLDKASEIRLKYKVGNYKELKERPVTFKDYVSKWIDKKSFSVSLNTYNRYKYFLIKKCAALNDMLMKNITSNDINEIIMYNARHNLAPSSLKSLKVTLNTLFNSAIDEEIISKNPIRGTIKPAKTHKKVDMVIPTEAEVREVLRVAKSYHVEEQAKKQKSREFNKVLYEFLLLAIATGMRKGELAGLKWSCIDFKHHKIKVEEQATIAGFNQLLKTSSSFRTISVDPEVLKVINKIPRDTKSPYVFKSGYSTSTALLEVITILVRKSFRQAGLNKGITLHSLRHFHATQLINKGVNVKVVSKRLGHSNIQITLDTYVHFLPSMDEEASLLVGGDYVF